METLRSPHHLRISEQSCRTVAHAAFYICLDRACPTAVVFQEVIGAALLSLLVGAAQDAFLAGQLARSLTQGAELTAPETSMQRLGWPHLALQAAARNEAINRCFEADQAADCHSNSKSAGGLHETSMLEAAKEVRILKKCFAFGGQNRSGTSCH